MSEMGSTLDRGTSTTDGARETMLNGALSPEAALNSNVARRKEGVEIIFSSNTRSSILMNEETDVDLRTLGQPAPKR